MTLFEIKRYFLKAGSSLRRSLEWQKKYTDAQGKSKIQRTGRFGVGVLAAFLLGDKILVETRNKVDKSGYKFEAAIDMDQINVLKDDSLNFGTSIKILLKEEALKKLKIIDEDSSSVAWYRWYILKSPEIKYKIFDKVIEPNKNMISDPIKSIPENWYPIDYKGFERILWTYNQKRSFSVNGIIIPQVYSILSREYSYDRTKVEVINEPPAVLLFDNDGILPLTLNRNNIDGKVPFENELLQDIYKDIIASLLWYQPKSFIENKVIDLKINHFTHGAIGKNSSNPFKTILYHNDGFTIKYGYFLNKLLGKELITILVGNTLPLSVTLEDNISNNYLFEIHYPNLKISYAKFWLDPAYYSKIGGIVSITEPTYRALFNSQKHSMTSGTKKNHIVLGKVDKWVTYSYLYSKSKFPHTDFILSKSENLVGITQSLIGKAKHIAIFDDLLKRYIGEHVIIPYSLEERKQLYSTAFSELDFYMRKYKA